MIELFYWTLYKNFFFKITWLKIVNLYWNKYCHNSFHILKFGPNSACFRSFWKKRKLVSSEKIGKRHKVALEFEILWYFVHLFGLCRLCNHSKLKKDIFMTKSLNISNGAELRTFSQAVTIFGPIIFTITLENGRLNLIHILNCPQNWKIKDNKIFDF